MIILVVSNTNYYLQTLDTALSLLHLPRLKILKQCGQDSVADYVLLNVQI